VKLSLDMHVLRQVQAVHMKWQVLAIVRCLHAVRCHECKSECACAQVRAAHMYW